MKTILNTNKGKIIIELNIENRPITTSNFIKLAKSGFYNGIRFHRVIAGFMIQSGDPLSADISKKDLWGTGGPDYMFNDEIDNQNNNIKYSISMANRGPNTNGSQWFINTNDNHFLNDKHTVFGQVIEGQDIVNDIEMQATDFSDKPINDIVIESVDILE